jgi:hypothetical protein
MFSLKIIIQYLQIVVCTYALLDAIKKVVLEVNAEKTTKVLCEISSCHGGEYEVQICLVGYTAV